MKIEWPTDEEIDEALEVAMQRIESDSFADIYMTAAERTCVESSWYLCIEWLRERQSDHDNEKDVK